MTSTDNIPGAEVERIGRLLFGDKWRAAMTRAFGVHTNTPGNWLANGAPRRTFLGHVALELARRERVNAKVREFLDSEYV